MVSFWILMNCPCKLIICLSTCISIPFSSKIFFVVSHWYSYQVWDFLPSASCIWCCSSVIEWTSANSRTCIPFKYLVVTAVGSERTGFQNVLLSFVSFMSAADADLQTCFLKPCCRYTFANCRSCRLLRHSLVISDRYSYTLRTPRVVRFSWICCSPSPSHNTCVPADWVTDIWLPLTSLFLLVKGVQWLR